MAACRIGSKFFFSFFVAALAAATVSSAAAQPPNLPIQPDLSGRLFTIRVVNRSHVPIYYKLVGGPDRSFVHQTLPPGRSEIETGVSGGDKVLCVWMPDEQVLLAVWVVRVDRNGKLVIPPLAAAAAGPGAAPGKRGPRSAPPAAASPRLSIVPE